MPGRAKGGFRGKVNELTESSGYGSEVLAEDGAQEVPAQTGEMEPQEALEGTSAVPEERRDDAPQSGPSQLFSPHQVDLIIILLFLLLFMYLGSED